ncbi:MAG: carbamoyltransferase HypF [Candidatus Omnitrophica bacterium]|nr:carbamoyltransferase HypF [Candidatus Omnitrophota bacterium]
MAGGEWRKALVSLERLRVFLHGAVQGVGFRPFVYGLAQEHGLRGWVSNTPEGLCIEAEGPTPGLQSFLCDLSLKKPAHAFVLGLESSYLDPVGYEGFEIRASGKSGPKSALILPDIATCAECLKEILNPGDRRFRYPFTNCTHCGPRFSIVEALPYDRSNTTMRGFEMCDECRAEYGDPKNRRFHAQPVACPQCGPSLELWNPQGGVLAQGHEALCVAARALEKGLILALKGLGGFQLMVDAAQEEAVAQLRARKEREEKPFALMFPSMSVLREVCEVSALEERLLLSPESPIVLLEHRQSDRSVAAAVAPGNPCLGAMLPYTPLHHLLLAEAAIPVVATSGNLSDEPICIDEQDALQRLGKIADLFLVHNRPVARHVDDSIARVVLGREMLLRRARGYAPLPITVNGEAGGPALAVGAHLKNAVAFSVPAEGDRTRVFLSQHIGDLDTPRAVEAFERTSADLPAVYEVKPERIVCDKHPDYRSSQWAQACGAGVIAVQHHVAHVLSCMAENELEGPVLGVAWDGTGLGDDGTIWGGEFLRAESGGCYERVAHLRQFLLPGGEAAVREPRRSALGLLYEMFGEELVRKREPAPLREFSEAELKTLVSALKSGVNTPRTSSAGRLFDAVSALLGIRQVHAFEGQAAMELEFAAAGAKAAGSYPFPLGPASQGAPAVLDWGPALDLILRDVDNGKAFGSVARAFHEGLAQGIVSVAQFCGLGKVVLTGGCFQNRLLTELSVEALRKAGFKPYWHQRVPPNDGGLALGQITFVSRCQAPVPGTGA